MEYKELSIGGKYPPIAGDGECVGITVDAAGITLIYNFSRPTDREIAAMDADQPFEIRFVSIGGVLYVLSKCGDLNWTDAPYTPHLSTGAPLEGIVNANDGYALHLILVDADTNTIKNMRLIGLGHQFSVDLYAAIEELRAQPFDAEQYNNTIRINNLLRRTSDLVAMATHKWRAPN